jgi:hypothetical protein
VIQRIFALALVVLIVLPFTVPFATVDLHHLTAAAGPFEFAPAVSAPAAGAQDDPPAWFERSDLHHSMEFCGLNGSGLLPAFVLTPPPAVAAAIAPSPTASALATFLRV